MKKSIIITCSLVLVLWAAVLCAAVVKTVSADIIGGAGWPTFCLMLTVYLRSPLGIAVLLITIAAAVYVAVLVVRSLIKKER